MLRLRGAFSANPRLVPIVDGTIKADGIEIEWQQIEPNTAFLNHLQVNDFDVFEFSLGNYLITHTKQPERWAWTGLPIFLSKAGPLHNARVSASSTIQSPADLAGKRFGLLEYGMTAGLWMRAMIYHLHGISPADISWFVDGGRDAVLGVRGHLPPEISITFLDREGAVAELLDSGELDAAFSNGPRPPTDASRPLAPDGGRAFFEAFLQKTACTPVNHTVLVQSHIVERDPWVAEVLYDAFERSKLDAYRRDRAARAEFRDGTDYDWQESVFGADPYPSGLAANRAMLTVAAEQSTRDGLIAGPPDLASLFHESLRAT